MWESPVTAGLGAVMLALLVWLFRYLRRRLRFPVTFEARVEYVFDGDSIRVVGRYGRVKLRLAAMDAPETEQPGGPESCDVLRARLRGERVTVRALAVDEYGRWVSRVWLDGRDVGLEMVRTGQAWVYRRYLGMVPPADRVRYLKAEADARSARRGLWAASSPEAPWRWRERRRTPWVRFVRWFKRLLRRWLGLRLRL